MAEKRKLPPRRESSVKRRVSEAPQPQPAKRNASTPGSRPPPPQERVRRPLPTKIKEGEALPTVPMPQPASLSTKDYQSIAQSAVLLLSLERSKKKWLSDGILQRYWTKPKKTKREQIEGRNPPKESMTKVGACNIVVGPHIFDAMLYTVKDPNAPPSIQYTPPQRPMLHYGHPGDYQPYQPYPNSPHHSWQPPYSHAHPSPSQPGYPSSQPQPPPRARPSNQSPHPPSQNGQRPSPSQNPQTPQPAKPSPDPVIQMLATRAASDPELKSLMRVVASSKATQEQLRTFQTHIDELNAIIKAREQQQQRQGQTPASAQDHGAQPSPQSQKPTEQAPTNGQQQTQQKPSQDPQVEVRTQRQSANPPSQTSTPQANETPQVKQDPDSAAPNHATPVATPSEPMRASASSPGVPPSAGLMPDSHTNSNQPSPAVRPMPQPPLQQAPGLRPAPSPYQAPPPIQSRPPQYGSPAQYYRTGPPPPMPKLSYRSVVFEFTSPLTPYGSSTSGHAGSGDRYLFPEHSILEWLPGGHTLIASFLVVKKVDPNAPFPIESTIDANNSRAKGKNTSKSKKAQEKPTSNNNTPQSTPSQQPPPPAIPTDQIPYEPDTQPQAQLTPLKEYYQPITFRIFSTNPRVLEPLARVVKPQDEVRRYMNEVMDRAERAPGGFLAFRLPREAEKPIPVDAEESGGGGGGGGGNDNVNNTARRSGTPANRTRLTRGRVAAAAEGDDGDENEKEEEEEGEGEESSPAEVQDGNEGEEEEEEELKDFYGSITGLPPLGV